MADPSTPQDQNTAIPKGERIALRRSLTLLGMTLLLPGSAQLAAGNKTVGRLALRIWGAVVGLLLAFGLLFLANRSWAIGLYANAITPHIVGWAVLLLGLGWAGLLVNAWRLGSPANLALGGRRLLAGVSLTTALVMVLVSVAAFTNFRSQASLFGSVFAGGGTSQTATGRINVLLLGGDAGADRVGMRPDSITVASINAATGRTVLISLPRNLQRAPIPKSNPLHAMYPNGFVCDKEECMLNGLWTLAEDHKKLFGNDPNPGLTTTRQVVEEIVGLKVNYYGLIDMEGFSKLIDAVGGIRLNIPYDVPISGEGEKPVRYINAGQNVLLDGTKALQFARTRTQSTDYARMVRQKCVMSAMLKQLDPLTVLTKFNEIAEASKGIVKTDVPSSDINLLLELALKAKNLPIASLSLTPPLINTVTPDLAAIKELVKAQLTASEDLDRKASASPASSGTVSPTTTGKPATAKPAATTPVKVNTASAYRPGQTDNLDEVCGVA